MVILGSSQASRLVGTPTSLLLMRKSVLISLMTFTAVADFVPENSSKLFLLEIGEQNLTGPPVGDGLSFHSTSDSWQRPVVLWALRERWDLAAQSLLLCFWDVSKNFRNCRLVWGGGGGAWRQLAIKLAIKQAIWRQAVITKSHRQRRDDECVSSSLRVDWFTSDN